MTSKRTRETLTCRLLRAVVIHARKHPSQPHQVVIGGRAIQVYAGKDSDFLAIDPCADEVIRDARREHLRKLDHAHTSLRLLGNKTDARWWLERAKQHRLRQYRLLEAV